MGAIKSASTEDAETLARLWTSTFRDAYHHLHAPENIDAYCAANYTLEEAEKVLSSDDYDCCIALSANQPTGFLVIKWAPCPYELNGASAELKQIYIGADAYGTGLGRALFERARSLLTERNIEWMWLAVADINARAKAFYEKNGFSYKGAGPQFQVGKDVLTSSILARRLEM